MPDLLPEADLCYVADRGRAPYGTKTLEEVASIAHQVTNWLIGEGATCVVVACNTASAAALHSIRERHRDLPVVGMEPAVKPAAKETASGTVAVYATATTFQGELYESVVSRFAAGVEVITRACPEWVDLVERGVVEGPEAESAIRGVVTDAVDAGADRIVLACTHFSFLAPSIERISGLEVIDPAPPSQPRRLGWLPMPGRRGRPLWPHRATSPTSPASPANWPISTRKSYASTHESDLGR
jgi:glutamate racemase